MTTESPDRILRRPEVEAITGKSTSQIYLDMSREEFPRPVRIGRKAVGWKASDIQNWIASREVV